MRLFSLISFSSVFCFWRFVLSVTLLNIFWKLSFNGFLEAFARDLDLLILQHNFCACNATEILGLRLNNISELFFKNMINNVTSDFISRRKWIWTKLIWRHLTKDALERLAVPTLSNLAKLKCPRVEKKHWLILEEVELWPFFINLIIKNIRGE